MTRATTPEEVVAVVSDWNLGIGPNELHTALGWTPAELERYQATGDLPDDQATAVAVDADLEGVTPTSVTGEGAHDLRPEDMPGHRIDEVNHALRPGPLRTSSEDYDDAGWMFYTRWRALPTGDGQWKVVGEHGEEDKEGPRRHAEYGPALDRAQELNRAEQMALIENTNKGDL